MEPACIRADGRVVSNFVIQALRNENITVYGEGRQTRSFCYVDDLVEGLIRLIETPDDVTAPVNLGNPVEVHDPATCRARHRAHGLVVKGRL